MIATSPIYVAPHYDDVALSCGGQVALAARTAHVVIATVFAGQPRGTTSAFVRFQHERWGVGQDAVSARRAEDLAAAQALGATVDAVWLDELDAIYRNAAYDSDLALFGAPHADDEQLVERIAGQLAELGDAPLHVPLAVGMHVDHQLVLQAGRRLAESGREVWAYADLPYALDAAAVADRLAMVDAGPRHLVALDAEAWIRKLNAIACYTSQLPVLFRGYSDYRAALEAQARELGAGELSEALWRVQPES